MIKYQLNECLVICDKCRKERKFLSRELVKLKRTPKEVVEKEGWEIKKEETICPDCVKEREYAVKKEQGFFRDLSYEQFQKKCNGEKKETRKLYLLEIADRIQEIAQKEKLLQDDEKLKIELYCLVHKITSVE